MKNDPHNKVCINPRDLDRPIRKIIEHFQDAFFHVEQSDLTEETKTRIVKDIQHAAELIRWELTGQPVEAQS